MNLKPNKNGNKNILLLFRPKRNLLTSPLVFFSQILTNLNLTLTKNVKHLKQK